MNKSIKSKLKEIDTENIISLIFAILSIINIYGNEINKKYLYTKNKSYKDNSKLIFEFTLFITIIINFYFFSRSYQTYKKSTLAERKISKIRLIAIMLLIIGTCLLLYLQKIDNEDIEGDTDI